MGCGKSGGLGKPEGSMMVLGGWAGDEQEVGEECLWEVGGPKTNFAFFAILPRALVVATACVPLKIVPMPGILHKWKQGTA